MVANDGMASPLPEWSLEEPLSELERQFVPAYLADAGADHHALLARNDDEARSLLGRAAQCASVGLRSLATRAVGNKFNLKEWNSDYFTRLTDFIVYLTHWHIEMSPLARILAPLFRCACIHSRLSTYLVVHSGDFQNAPKLLLRRSLFSTTPAA